MLNNPIGVPDCPGIRSGTPSDPSGPGGGHPSRPQDPAAPPLTTASRRHLERPRPVGRLRVTTACHHLGWGFKGEKGNRFCVSSTRHHSCTCSMQSIILRCRCLLIHHGYSDAFHSDGPPAFLPHILGSVASPSIFFASVFFVAV